MINIPLNQMISHIVNLFYKDINFQKILKSYEFSLFHI